MDKQRTYVCIDLKSYYASVECVERGLDPLRDNLVVADESRTDKTICLAVSPSLKSYGIGGRGRLFEVKQKVREINRERQRKIGGRPFRGKSVHDDELKRDPYLELDFVIAVPRMSFYMEYSAHIYDIYLKYIAPEDIHVYSIDEVFMDVTDYLNVYHMTAHELTIQMIHDVLSETGVTATAGIGTNMYLAKVAMDITAKHMPADKDGVRIAELDEISYRQKLWEHRPLTDFWRVGHGYQRRLEEAGLYTMGDIARCSVGKFEDKYNEDLLYSMFGVNAELLIDHAWGYEPCTMQDIKKYRPQANSLGSGQVLAEPYTYEKAAVIVREMTDALTFDLVNKHLITDTVVLMIGYDSLSLSNPNAKSQYQGEISTDWYGRSVPKHAHGTAKLKQRTSSSKLITDAVMKLYARIADKRLLVRRIGITCANVVDEKYAEDDHRFDQLDLFADTEETVRKIDEEREALAREHKVQEAILSIRRKYGKNAVLKGTDFQEGATMRERNKQIGGHKS
ncbi:MAG: DNA methylase [Solobacterium sp.]|nr:DNA methylase [Solobacterium sp.]